MQPSKLLIQDNTKQESLNTLNSNMGNQVNNMAACKLKEVGQDL